MQIGANRIATLPHRIVDFSRDCVVVGSVDTPNNWSTLPLTPDDGARILENGAALIPQLKHAEVLAENIGLRPVRKWGVRIEYQEVSPELKARTHSALVHPEKSGNEF